MEELIIKKMQELIGWREREMDGIFSPGKLFEVCLCVLLTLILFLHSYKMLPPSTQHWHSSIFNFFPPKYTNCFLYYLFFFFQEVPSLTFTVS